MIFFLKKAYILLKNEISKVNTRMLLDKVCRIHPNKLSNKGAYLSLCP